VPLVEDGRLDGPEVEAVIRRSLAPLLGSEVAGEGPTDPGDASFVFPRAPGARIDTLLLGCTHYPLLSPVIRAIVGEDTAVIDSASATASALASLVEIHALGTPDHGPGRHTMLTTGDVGAFEATATLLFGEGLSEIEGLALATTGAGRVAP